MLRAAILGLGVGAEHAQAYVNLLDVELAALCDTNGAKLAQVGARYPEAAQIENWRDIADDPKIDLVSICTPDWLHYEQAAALIRQGKHLLVEKPMAMTTDQARELIELVYEHGVSLAVGNVCRYMPPFATALSMAKRNDLGELFFLEADYVHDMRPVLARTPWRIDPERPQSAIFGGGVHPLDLLQQAGGTVQEVFAYGSDKTLADYNAHDSILISLRFESGAVGKCWVTFGVRQQPHNRINLNLYGERGSVRASTAPPTVQLYVEDMGIGQNDWATIPVRHTIGHPVREELENLVEAIRYGREPRVNVVDGARTVALMEAAQASLERGQPVAVEHIEKPRQLTMIRPHLEDLPRMDLADGYGLRTFQPGDASHWLRICKPEFGMGWDAAALHRQILDAPFFEPEHMFFVTHGDQPVGVACAWRAQPDQQIVGTLHYIAVQPEHRGKGLGRVLLGAVLRKVRELGFAQCDLSTNDYRWAAIGLYWHYGFRPVIKDELDARRWATIQRRLGVK